MNFFQSQDNARSNTKKLVLLFALAVICLIVLTNVFLVAIFTYLEGSVLTMQSFTERFDWNTFLVVGAGVAIVVFISSLYKVMALSGGGGKIMSYMDAEIIIQGSGDNDKQKVLNVVEEMAIASGTPVPQVYLLNEPGINAFAAGLTARDAAIGVTRGAIENLTRDQLQGVIAHEFSHILNGDMRLNIRLIGILYGIMVIGLIGEFFLYSGSHRSNSKNNNMLIGLGLMVIGYAGTFFGNWIKAAVSRQREFLADASAVQFTRNPEGIAGALIKIGGYAEGSQLKNPHGSEISHALFSEGVTVYFKSILATHPPLATRIKRILPGWDGKFIDSNYRTRSKVTKTNDQHEAVSGFSQNAAFLGDEFVNRVGQPTTENIQQAKKIIHDLPYDLYQSAHEPHGARAVIYFLLLDKDPAIRQEQLRYCFEHADDGVYSELKNFVAQVKELDIKYRLAIIDIALPALRQLSNRQEQLFLKIFIALIKMDSKISVFEWAVQKIVFTELAANFIRLKIKDIRYLSLQKLKNECSIVISFLIYLDANRTIKPEEVFLKVKSGLNLDIKLVSKNNVDLKKIDNAVDKLKRLKPLIKPQLLKACALAITGDNKVTPAQIELYRAISSILDCPMPPLNDY
jgi:Zn-dependent protease with chaperone function